MMRPISLVLPLAGGTMNRISLAWFAELGVTLKELEGYPAGAADDKSKRGYDMVRAKEILEQLTDTKALPLSLKASRAAINNLINALGDGIEETKKLPAEEDKSRLPWELYRISWAAEQLAPVLRAELSVQAVYQIAPKRAYDIDTLIDNGTAIFSDAVKLSFTLEEKYDVEQAGKCLAVEVPTAAAFHLFRAAESVMRRYYTIVVGTLPKAKMRNWGAYLKALKKCNADSKVLNALEQIKDLHRNPVLHPETRINNDEALSLVGMIESVVGAMVADMKRRQEAALVAAALPKMDVPTDPVPTPTPPTVDSQQDG